VEKQASERAGWGVGRRRARRVAKYLLVGAVLAMVSAWVVMGVQPWVKRARPGMVSISDHPLHGLINRWSLLTASSTVRGDWVQNRDALTQRESRTGAIAGLTVQLSRSIDFMTTAREVSATELDALFKPAPGVTVGGARTVVMVEATYSESDRIAGFPFPCMTIRYAVGATSNAPMPNIRFFRPLRWLEEGVNLPWFGGSRLALPLLPWLPGFVPNMLLWAGVAWGCRRGWQAVRARRAARLGLCASCGDAAGGAVCPECGR
jgi:hypothetical protein